MSYPFDSINAILERISYDLVSGIPVMIYGDKVGPIDPELQPYLDAKLTIDSDSIKIYYRISKINLWNLIPMEYSVDDLTLTNLLGAIWSFYQTPVPQEYIDHFIAGNSNYEVLRERENITFLDMLEEKIYIKEIIPYEDGYEIKFEA